MDEKRVYEIAAEFFPFLNGDNDAIAANPRRWHEEMTSWSEEEACCVVAALIHKAVTEAIEHCAVVVEAQKLTEPAMAAANKWGAAGLMQAVAAAAIRNLKPQLPQHSSPTGSK